MILSIIIPVYNVESYLRECLESILCQIKLDEENIEILLVDDGSTDSSGKICDEYSEKYNKIVKVFHKNNEGLLLTRRYGFNKATGKYIMNVDSDDLIEMQAIKSIFNVINDFSPDMIIFNTYFYNEEKKTIWYKDVFDTNSKVVDKKSVVEEYITRNTVTSMCGKIFKRECLELTKDYRGYSSYGEDSLQTAEILRKANSFYYLNEVLYDYRCGSGMTAKFYDKYYLDYCRVCEEIRKTQELHIIDDFELKLSVRFFSIVGRAITQSRWEKPFESENNKLFLESICKDKVFVEMLQYFPRIKNNLQFDYRILVKLLISKQYGVIYKMLKVKNWI